MSDVNAKYLSASEDLQKEKTLRDDSDIQILNLRESVENAQAQRDAIAEKLKSIALERDRLEEGHQKSEKDTAVHLERLEELTKLNAQYSSEIDFLKQQLDEMTGANSEISTENARLWNEVQKFMVQLEESKGEISSLQERISTSADSNAALSDFSEGQLIKANEELAIMRENVTKQISERDAELDKTRTDACALELRLVELLNEVLYHCLS